jgi:replicative DNA helicase
MNQGSQTEQDYIARQLLSTLWMCPEYIPVVSQVLNHDGLLPPTAEYVWQTIKNHVGNGKLNIPVALMAIERNAQADAFFKRAQAENYSPKRYSERQITEWASALAEQGLRGFGEGIAEKIKGRMGDRNLPLDESISESMKELAGLRSQGGPNTWRSQPEIGKHSRQILAAWRRGEVAGGVATGFISVDKILGGFRNGELSLIAARPSMGKTAAACNIIVNIAERYKAEGSNKCVAFFSAETSGELLQLRMAYALAGVNQAKSRARKTSPEEEQQVDDALAWIESLPIYIDESPAPTTQNMLLRALALDNVVIRGEQKKVGIVFFDFVELAGDKEPNEEQRISKIAIGLKIIGKQLGCPMVALSQLNRSADGRMPKLSDLRYSGMLEQVAYAVIFIHRDSYYKKRASTDYNPLLDPERHQAVWMIAKNKDGPTGPVEMRFEEEFARFADPRDERNGW